MRRAFTLIELLVVIVIISIVVGLSGVVIYNLRKPSLDQGARTVQAAFAGARDDALRSGAPSGLRFLLDPAFPLQYDSTPGSPTFGQILPGIPLAANRIIPLTPAPDYSEGRIDIVFPAVGGQLANAPGPVLVPDSLKDAVAKREQKRLARQKGKPVVLSK